MSKEPQLEPEAQHLEYARENRVVAERLRERGLDALAAVYDATAAMHDAATQSRLW